MYPDNPDDLYRIGTVASLTGISVERLRAWERRYNLSPAHKAGKTRFYSKDQLERLKLIKHLIDQGQPISSLAPLNHEQLAQRISEQPRERVIVALQAPTVGLIGPNLLVLEQQASKADSRQRIEVVSRWANMDAFYAEQSGTVQPSVLIMQVPVLSMQHIEKTKEIYPDAKLITIYQFATADMISRVQQAATPTLKWPVSWAEIEHTALSEGGLPARAGRTTPRRYSDEELIAIAANSEDPTGCPEHLVEAINQLNAFAAFTSQCAPAQERGDLYLRVHADTTQARAQLELALETLITADEQHHTADADAG